MFGKSKMVDPRIALPGRSKPVLREPCLHEIFGIPVTSTPAGSAVAYLALGCFWGAEKLYWQTPGVTCTAVGYQGGYTPNPTYEEVCLGRTGHAETVRICFVPERISYAELLRIFFENHDPTQGMRQGNDVGTQYRSAIFTTDEDQARIAEQVKERYAAAFRDRGYGPITTETKPAGEFYYAENYHQQYLAKNPSGYCPIHATGVTCDLGG